MELSWLMRLRIATALAIGIVLLGLGAWPLAKPLDPQGAVTLFTHNISIPDTMIFLVLAYLAGLAAWFASYPYGLEIAPIAAPAGLAVVALRTGDMTSLLRVNNTLAQRQVLYAALKWEGFFWLAICAAGYFGVLTAQKMAKRKPAENPTDKGSNSLAQKTLTIITALVATVVITQFLVRILAQDVKMFDSELGSVVGQPATLQIGFAVFVAFAIAGFVVKKFLDLNYIVGAIAAALLTLFSIMTSTKYDVLNYMVQTWPIAFYPRPGCAILPIQTVVFGVLGSIAGYWMSVKFTYWQKHKSR